MAAMIGSVEKELPMPIVTRRPMTSMVSTTSERLSPKKATLSCTSGSMPPLAFMMAAKPLEVMMMKAIMLIRRMPLLKIVSACCQRMTRVTIKMAKPISPARMSEPLYFCVRKAAMTAVSPMTIFSGLTTIFSAAPSTGRSS